MHLSSSSLTFVLHLLPSTTTAKQPKARVAPTPALPLCRHDCVPDWQSPSPPYPSSAQHRQSQAVSPAQRHVQRRAVLTHLLAMAPACGLLMCGLPAAVAAAATPQPPRTSAIHSELSELASKLPGVGMPDVYYPPFFLGQWLVSRELYAVETGAGLSGAPGHSRLSTAAVDELRRTIGKRETFRIRFFEHRGHVIEDREFNARGECMAEAGGSRLSVVWQPDEPNVMSVSWGAPLLDVGMPGRTTGGSSGRLVSAASNVQLAAAGGSGRFMREVKVTKRSFVDAPLGYGSFVSSEYTRVVDVQSDGALLGFGRPPSIYARRRIMRYQVSSLNEEFKPDGMNRLFVEYIYPPSPPNADVAVVLKYRDFLKRRSGITDLVGT